MNRIRKISILLFFALGIAACKPAPDGGEALGTGEQIAGQAVVEDLNVLILEGFPHEVQVLASGTLSDGCTTVDQVSMSRSAHQFTGVISTVRPAEAICTQMLVPFERLIPLDMEGLEAGEYTVIINDVETTFNLQEDNIEPTPTPVDNALSSLSGRVWHDLCATAGGVPGIPEVVTDGCVESVLSGYIANGRRETDEPGLGGIEVSLGSGACPEVPILTSQTDENGRYSFSGLKAGTYCVFIDPLSPTNRPLLIPGVWSAPEPNKGFLEVDLGIADQFRGADFGWDYENLPPLNFEGCENQAQFIDDITIPDDSVFAPREVFTKTWRLRNSGTCHWGPEYSLDFAAGDQLGGEAVPLPEVLAGETVEVSVRLQAPELEGSYRGDWQLKDPDGDPFGTVGEFDLTFFVKIVVKEPEIRTAAIRGLVWDDRCAVLAGGSPSEGCTTDAEGDFIANGILDDAEPGLQDVIVALYKGTCPPRGEPFLTTTTLENGEYLFEDLDPGLYCVNIDEGSETNLSILESGRWSYPAVEVSSVNIEVAEDEIREGIDFGWDFEID